jgi:hypothetical protein
VAFTLEDAVKFSCDETSGIAGRYYGPVAGLALGGGIFYGPVIYPAYNTELGRFQAYSNPALVLTHECDVEQGNDKLFNTDVLMAPIFKFEDLYAELMAKRNEAECKAYIGDFVKGRISQLFYLPPAGGWDNGGAIALNRLTSTHIAEFQKKGVGPLHALSSYAYDALGRALEAHLLRPKDDRLPLTPTLKAGPGSFQVR